MVVSNMMGVLRSDFQSNMVVRERLCVCGCLLSGCNVYLCSLLVIVPVCVSYVFVLLLSVWLCLGFCFLLCLLFSRSGLE